MASVSRRIRRKAVVNSEFETWARWQLVSRVWTLLRRSLGPNFEIAVEKT